MKITPERIRELEKAEEKLTALENAGVDNWDGYGDALEAIRKREALDEEIDAALDEVMCELGGGAYEPSERGAGVAFHQGAELAARTILRKLILEKVGPL